MSEVAEIKSGTVHVYNGGIRLWHWVNALCILVLAVTGYFIGSPLPSVPGEASEHFLMGYIRFTHFSTAYILTIGFLARFYLALIGDHHARQIFFPSLWSKKFWGGAWHQLSWYLFLVKEPHKWVGHNPLSTLTMFIMYTLMTVFMILTGGAMYAEGMGEQSWQYAMFGWVIAAMGNNTMWIHTMHHLGMWVIITFVIVHIYTAVREDAMSRQTMISVMISGDRTFRDDRDD